ncbi:MULTISPECIES: 3-oxoacyl-[acyl-carrier-protein] reductase [Aerococcus]|uniref:3-oxoacyl-[acyl-carrier-protein] reductase n=2 Tax=Aerococcus TaxID=1375 RepID=A0A178HDY8_9LACT|nr:MULTISPECIES: 3-oxoacyl-[acyl-carrier-protein] reductase [Aerococcus]KAA9221146.1 3-oxoacyl-[acyl-carrier-protein] reductase [Aerococcus loyolae]KAA9264839.1 3-oxoacyl-[acyl-carrier-protein] reductase [Aerococcus loyolae]MCY3025447.1 3-oxoacyl-[acyl-carrier-protein] reductase [Aerococcus loyolae]MCY3026608.1 3-oxoacyl-[acyl-carrier-protein] reductase [Aerococcus loyolae]MCY3028285.1 3-oxoacyl-[acyl-carrier-protein] reductase [Aerococcus loyolae]
MTEKPTAIITGGNRGIGAAIAREFADKGYNLALVSRSGSSQDHINDLSERGATVLDLKAEVQDFDQAQAIIERCKEEYSHIDVLVNNAGITRDTLLMRMKEADFDAVIDVNLKGCFNLIRHVSKVMLKQKRGNIINIASLSGQIGNAGQINYAAAKAGVIAMTKTAARELASRGIRVNAVAPGFIASDMTDKLSDKVKEQMIAQIPLGDFGRVEDIADAVYFLVKNPYITGTTLNVNGGLYME